MSSARAARPMKLYPSILAADFTRLGEEIELIEGAGVTWLHVDVMDGHFVDPISFGEPLVASIRPRSKLLFDIHLMVDNPVEQVERFAEYADSITFHVEAARGDTQDLIDYLHARGLRAGVSLCPETPISTVLPYAQTADMILVMTVHPGKGGQQIIPECLDKVSELRSALDTWELATDIQVDGGITIDNLDTVRNMGATAIVAGSAVFRGDIVDNIRKMTGE